MGQRSAISCLVADPTCFFIADSLPPVDQPGLVFEGGEDGGDRRENADAWNWIVMPGEIEMRNTGADRVVRLQRTTRYASDPRMRSENATKAEAHIAWSAGES